MRGKVISIKANDPTSGILATATGELFVYKLPQTIKAGDKIKYSPRISQSGNLYAVYLAPYSQTDIKIHTIDFERRMTSMEYLVLYYYYLIKEKGRTDYSDQTFKEWILTEELIENYNSDTEDIKQDAAELSARSFDMFNTMFTAERWNYEKPVIWKDRKKTPYFIKQLTESHRFEVFVDTLFRQHGFDIGLYYGREQQYSGETRVGIEIKLDKKLKETKNVYIEYQERMCRDGEWVNSGILKSDNTKMIFLET
jgi:hypothetical protein